MFRPKRDASKSGNGARIGEEREVRRTSNPKGEGRKNRDKRERERDGVEKPAEGGKQGKIKQRKNRVAGKRMRALSAGGNYSDYANSGSVPLLYPAVPQTHCLPAAVCAIFHG